MSLRVIQPLVYHRRSCQDVSTSAVLFSGKGNAAWNMAVDEALLRCAQEEGARRLILRFYGWERPSLTMGYFQHFSTACCSSGDAVKDFPIVRRPTGGGSVCHSRDLTYSLVYPQGALTHSYRTDYQFVHRLIKNVLCKIMAWDDLDELPQDRAHQGRVTHCFAEPSAFDLMHRGKKIAGAAQRRSKGWILHQGSLDLGKDFGARALWELQMELVRAFEAQLDLKIFARELSPREVFIAKYLFAHRYATDAWNRKF